MGRYRAPDRRRPLVCLIDAFDSFVYVIEQYLGELGVETTVLRSSRANTEKLSARQPDAIVLGPGPGTPEDSGHIELINAFHATTPLLGVCLGHQAIAVAFGGSVVRAEHIMHGKRSKITHDGQGMYAGMAGSIMVTRYHSLVVDERTVPGCLTVSSTSDDDAYIMGLRHQRYPIESVQFHPESISTDDGMAMLTNFQKSVGLGAGRTS